ncbi:MAG: sugar phosphate nucleotidyltransferase [Chitinophagaceae bacterium]
MECIILAGGLGTRLRSEVSEWPKSMAPILGKPFVSYLLQLIHKAGATHIIFSVGYLSHTIQNYFGDTYEGIKISYANELEPLGTGGL